MFVSVGMSQAPILYTRAVNTLFTPFFMREPLTTRKTGVAGRNPLTAPARALPAGHITLTKALLSGLDHPWPHRERPATTRARPPVALLTADLREGLPEAAHRMLVLHT